MNEPVFSIRLNASTFRIAAHQASREGISVEHWLGAIALKYIAEKCASQRFVPGPNQESHVRLLCELLDKAPDNPPDPGDELPEGYLPAQRR